METPFYRLFDFFTSVRVTRTGNTIQTAAIGKVAKSSTQKARL